MNNLLIRTSQLDGVFVTHETMQNLVDQLSAISSYQFNVLKKYVEDHCLSDDEIRALFGTRLNRSKTHRIQGYFGPKTIYAAADLLSPLQRQKVLSYYCNASNYEIAEWNGNVFDGKSPIKGPCLTFVVKFMEEIIGFKNTPEKVYNLGLNGNPLPKAYRKLAPLVGFNNNFQPEDYMNAPNKLVYMRGLTVVQKILALHWLTMGNYAFREDLLVIRDEKKELKKKRKERKPKKPRKLRKKTKLSRDGDAFPDFPSNIVDIPIGNDRVQNSISRDEFRRQPLFQQVQYLYEMLGGSMVGRCNQKLAPDERVSRADFMAATLNQQTMWLYRQIQRMDEDGADDRGFRKHLGKHYKIGGLAGAITNLRKLSKGRVTQQTHFLGKRAMKHETKIQRCENNVIDLKRRLWKTEEQIKLIRKKLFVDKDKLKDKMDELDKDIKKGGGIASRLNLINMIAGYAIDAVLTVIASTALALAVEAKHRLDDHDVRFSRVYKFLTDDLLARFNFIWDELAHLSEDVTLVHLETQRAERKLADLHVESKADRKSIEAIREELADHQERLSTIAEGQEDLMEFRNRIEILLVTVSQFFEREGISFTGPDGEPVGMDNIRREFEDMYNRFNKRIEEQAVKIKAVAHFASTRIDALERQLELERDSAAAARHALEERITAQDALIRRLTERLDSIEIATGAIDISAVTERVSILEDRVQQTEALANTHTNDLAKLTTQTGRMQTSLAELAAETRSALEESNQRCAANEQAIADFRADLDELFFDQQSITALESRVNEVESITRGLQATVMDVNQFATENRRRITQLTDTVSALQSTVWALDIRVDKSEALMGATDLKIETIQSSMTNVQRICRSLKTQYVIRCWVPNQRTDGNGFMRLSLSSFPSDMVSKLSDYIVAIQVYNGQVSTYDCAFVSWINYRSSSEINLSLKWAYSSSIGQLGSGVGVRIWYWARNSAENYDL